MGSLVLVSTLLAVGYMVGVWTSLLVIRQSQEGQAPSPGPPLLAGLAGYFPINGEAPALAEIAIRERE